MSFRKSLSKVRDKVKHRLSKLGEREGDNVSGKGFDRSTLSLQPVVGGEGCDIGEATQSDSHLHPHMEVESGSGRGGRDRANACQPDVGDKTPTPPISPGGESEGM